MEAAPALADPALDPAPSPAPDPAPLALQVVTASGSAVALEPTPGAEESVAGLRCQVALALGRPHSQIQLLCGQAALADGPLLSEAVGTGEATVTAVVVQLPLEELKEHIQVDRQPHCHQLDDEAVDELIQAQPRRRWKGCSGSGKKVEFPVPRDININMLPFVMGKRASLPEEYWHYWPMIQACGLPRAELGKVGYLTIQESLVPAWEQRRPGLLARWRGELYMASSVEGSCRVWQAPITDAGLVARSRGDLEHLRRVLGDGHLMAANELYRLTDRLSTSTVVVESLPLHEETYRQCFRLVTSRLSAWFPEHSTANRCGTEPDPAVTKIIKGSKFDV